MSASPRSSWYTDTRCRFAPCSLRPVWSFPTPVGRRSARTCRGCSLRRWAGGCVCLEINRWEEFMKSAFIRWRAGLWPDRFRRAGRLRRRRWQWGRALGSSAQSLRLSANPGRCTYGQWANPRYRYGNDRDREAFGGASTQNGVEQPTLVPLAEYDPATNTWSARGGTLQWAQPRPPP